MTTKEALDAALATMVPQSSQDAPQSTLPDREPPEVIAERKRVRQAERDASEERRSREWREANLRTRVALEHRIAAKMLAALKKHRTPCALLLGPTGCGKTTAAQWMTTGTVSNFLRARDLATATKRHGLGDGRPPEVETAREHMLLVIDDVGSEGSDVAALQDALDYRYSRQLPTIVTSGLTESELSALLGPAYYRRIVDQHVPRKDGEEFPVLIVDCHEAQR